MMISIWDPPREFNEQLYQASGRGCFTYSVNRFFNLTQWTVPPQAGEVILFNQALMCRRSRRRHHARCRRHHPPRHARR